MLLGLQRIIVMTAPISGGWQGRPYDKRCMWVILPNPNTHPMMQHSTYGPCSKRFSTISTFRHHNSPIRWVL